MHNVLMLPGIYEFKNSVIRGTLGVLVKLVKWILCHSDPSISVWRNFKLIVMAFVYKEL